MPNVAAGLTAYACGHEIDPTDTRRITPTKPCPECAAQDRREYMREYMRLRRAGISGGIRGWANSRKTHCPQGHPYDDENTRITSGGDRKCRECERASVRKQHEKDPDLSRRSNAKWRAENPELHRERARQWQKDNPEKANAIGRLKKHRRRAAGVITPKEWADLLAWYGGRCLCCGATEAVTLDHVIPVSRGGLNVIANVQPLCRTCNCRKATRTIDFRMTSQSA